MYLWRLRPSGVSVKICQWPTIVYLYYHNNSPGLRVTAGAHQRQRTHDHRKQPTDGHYVDRGAELEPTVEVYGVSDGVPTFAGDDHQREHGQHARKHGQETGNLATDTCAKQMTARQGV